MGGDSAAADGLPEEFDRDEVIARLYDVALNPANYERLLDHWERTVGPLRVRVHDDTAGFLDDRLIVEHFRRADVFLDKIDPSQDRDEIADLVGQFDKVAVAVFSPRGEVLGANAGARQTLGARPGVGVADLLIDDGDRDPLVGQIRRMASRPGRDPAVFRIRAADLGRFIVLHLRVCDLARGGPVVVAITSEVSWPDAFPGILKAAFDLTAAEIDVARMLIDCCSLRDIAEARDRSIDTVRVQIKSLLAKTETKSQVELVRLILSMMDIACFTFEAAPVPRAVGATGSGLPARAFQTFFRAGRRLDYLEFGDPAGRPVVFFHQNYGLCRWPASAEIAAEAMGLRVLVPIRAGYGASEDAPPGGDYAACVAADLEALLDRLHLPAAQAITLGSDFHLAAHFAARRPGRMPVILACAGVLPMTSADHYQRMHKWHRFILAGARYTPHLLPFMVKAGFHLARRNGKQAFVDSVFGKTRADLATFADPEVFEAMITGSEIALSTNHTAHEAYARQIIQQETTDWRPLVAALEGRVRVAFFNGLQDPKVAPETLDEFRADYPWIDWRIYEDAGALAFFRHWPDVLAALDPA